MMNEQGNAFIGGLVNHRMDEQINYWMSNCVREGESGREGRSEWEGKGRERMSVGSREGEGRREGRIEWEKVEGEEEEKEGEGGN